MESINKELRQAVLQAAIQGKLTKQLPEDGNARDLLKQIKDEKERLIKEKKIKKEKVLESITEDEIPFDIPDNWSWCYLQDIVNIRSSVRIHQSDWRTSGIPFYRAREIVKIAKQGYVDNDLFIDNSLYKKYAETSGVPHKGDLMVSGVGTLGACFVVNSEEQFYYKDASVLCFENFAGIDAYFLKLLMDTPHLYSQIYASEAFGTTVATLTMERAYSFIIPVPPLAEQHRIVARVKELMAKIDELEKVETELQSLYQAFPNDMKAALLQDAMQGKLTEQLPEDGDASDLLKQIKNEKERLIREKKIRKEKVLVPIKEDEIPFDIPDNWEWVRLRDIINIYGGLSYNKNNLLIKSDNMVTVFRGGNIGDLSYCFKSDDVKISKEFIKNDELYLRKNWLITPAVTSLQHLGKIARIDKDYNDVVAGGFVLNIVPFFNNDIFSKFFLYSFSRWDMKKRCADIANKSGQAFYNLSREKLLDSLFPFPPLAEQKRIVEKLDRLLPLCDSLQIEL